MFAIIKKIEQFAKKFTLFLEILWIVCAIFLATRMAMMMVGVKMTEDESVESSDEEVSH
jgi:preprotein translocase subunit SecG